MPSSPPRSKAFRCLRGAEPAPQVVQDLAPARHPGASPMHFELALPEASMF